MSPHLRCQLSPVPTHKPATKEMKKGRGGRHGLSFDKRDKRGFTFGAVRKLALYQEFFLGATELCRLCVFGSPMARKLDWLEDVGRTDLLVDVGWVQRAIGWKPWLPAQRKI